MSSENQRTVSQRVISCTAALSLAASLGACGTAPEIVKAYADREKNADNPCSGMRVDPYTPANHEMALIAAGVNVRTARGFAPVSPSFVSSYYVDYGYNNVPTKAVMVIPTVNGIHKIVTVSNSESNAGKLSAGFIAAAAVGGGFGSAGAVIRALGFGIAAGEAGRQLIDQPLDEYRANRINACYAHIQSGAYDVVRHPVTGRVGVMCREQDIPTGFQGNQFVTRNGTEYLPICPSGIKGFEQGYK